MGFNLAGIAINKRINQNPEAIKQLLCFEVVFEALPSRVSRFLGDTATFRAETLKQP